MIGKKWNIFFVLFLIAGTGTVLSADIEITSVVNSTKIGINENLILTVTVSGAEANRAGAPQLTSMPAFSFSQTGSSTEVSIVNFKTMVTKIYTYVLVPKKTGVFNIGVVTVNMRGVLYEAPGTKVEVVSVPTGTQSSPGRQSIQSASDENIFTNAFTDKEEVYIGEQITYTFELYNRLSLSDTGYEPPATTGFWVVELQEIPRSIKISGGRQYYYNVIKSALFPTTSGELTIGPAELVYTTQAGFFSTGPKRTLKTEPIAIKVKPLPESGRPDDFSGVVGKFSISSAFDNTTVKAGDVITIHVSITGKGNLDLVTSLTEPDLSEFKTYDPKVTGQLSNSGFTVGGRKTWEYIIIPREPGKTTLKPFRLSYFNPEDKTYHTASTRSMELTITPGYAVASVETGTGDLRGSIASIATDIRYIKPDKRILKNVQRKVYTTPYFYLLYALPLGLLFISVAVKKRQDTIERNTGLKRKLKAWKQAHKRLAEAKKILKDGNRKDFCGKLHDTITTYIGDMLNIDDGGLTSSELEKLVKEKGVASDLAERIRTTMEMCDFVRFASSGNDLQVHETMLNDTQEIITELRKVL